MGLDPFRLFQVLINRFEEETGLNFDSLEPYDSFGSGVGPETVRNGDTREITDASQVR